MLAVRKLGVFYGESQVLRDVDLVLKPGRITALMGRNGVGKSTLLKAITGLLPARAGEVRFQGRKVNGLAPEKRARMGLAYVPQGREIFPKLTIEENLLMGLEARTDGLRKIPEDEIYGLFPVLAQMKKRLGGNLSGGQQQQLAIARALVGDPKVLLLDEPTAGVDVGAREEIYLQIEALAESGCGVLLVSSDLDEVLRMCDRTHVMYKGRITATIEGRPTRHELMSAATGGQ